MKKLKKSYLVLSVVLLMIFSIIPHNANAAIQSKTDEIINYAKQQIGKPYKWNGTGPDNFDCSGFTQYVYRNVVGVDITRSTYSQVKFGQPVPLSEARNGDLVFFGDPASPHHVGLYIFPNKYIHSPQTGRFVEISNIYDRRDVVQTVRRVQGWIKYDGKWSFLSKGNYIYNEWVYDNNKYYYFNNSGYMESDNWVWSNGKCYYLNSDGVMETDKWIWDSKTQAWYHVDGNGAMDTNTWLWDNDSVGWFYVGSDGAMQKGWITVDGKEYYLDQNGKMLTNTVIEGKRLGPDGAVIK
ncbi:NlpC/P60 family protein [Clostridium sp.]|uniref:C40 family peptidase n=1 Tax=Clostridium sp. TaxID=1506 RepID=UPI00346435EE